MVGAVAVHRNDRDDVPVILSHERVGVHESLNALLAQLVLKNNQPGRARACRLLSAGERDDDERGQMLTTQPGFELRVDLLRARIAAICSERPVGGVMVPLNRSQSKHLSSDARNPSICVSIWWSPEARDTTTRRVVDQLCSPPEFSQNELVAQGRHVRVLGLLVSAE